MCTMTAREAFWNMVTVGSLLVFLFCPCLTSSRASRWNCTSDKPFDNGYTLVGGRARVTERAELGRDEVVVSFADDS